MDLFDIRFGCMWTCEFCQAKNSHTDPIVAGDELQCDFCDSTYIVEEGE